MATAETKQSEWIEWAGGECPVARDVFVEIKDRVGEIDGPLPAHMWSWDWVPTWPESDIIAYRVVPA